MIGLTSLEIYISFFIITEENNKFEPYKLPDSKSGGVSYERVREEIGIDLEITVITATNLLDNIKGPIIIQELREQAKN